MDTLQLPFTTGGGVANGDVTDGELWEDTNGNGTWDGLSGDTRIQGAVTPASGVLTFTTDFTPSLAGTTYFVRATVSSLISADTTTFSLGTAGVLPTATGATVWGSTTNAVFVGRLPSGV